MVGIGLKNEIRNFLFGAPKFNTSMDPNIYFYFYNRSDKYIDTRTVFTFGTHSINHPFGKNPIISFNNLPKTLICSQAESGVTIHIPICPTDDDIPSLVDMVKEYKALGNKNFHWRGQLLIFEASKIYYSYNYYAARKFIVWRQKKIHAINKKRPNI
jgi:hypothetical protein